MGRVHYEAAFEAYLRARRIPYIAVDEARRAALPGGARLAAEGAARGGPGLKSFDFVVYGAGVSLLLDVKGRRAGAGGGGRLESWATADDVASLREWERLCGAAFQGALVFVYWCEGEARGGLFQEVFEHGGRLYALRAVGVGEYERAMRVRSARWRTVHVPGGEFERISRPFTGVWCEGSGAPRGVPGDEALQAPAAAVWSAGAEVQRRCAVG